MGEVASTCFDLLPHHVDLALEVSRLCELLIHLLEVLPLASSLLLDVLQRTSPSILIRPQITIWEVRADTTFVDLATVDALVFALAKTVPVLVARRATPAAGHVCM